MPRGPRLIVPEIAVHIVQRGHDRRDCFRHDTDYLVYLANLRDLAVKKGCVLHAYCLMTNHIHLLVTPSTADACALLMRNLGQRYVQYFNRRYKRSGTLWEGRFKSCLVDTAQYLIACYRYVERNPVRAGMVASASDYPWSSHNGNAGRAANRLLTPHPEYLAWRSRRRRDTEPMRSYLPSETIRLFSLLSETRRTVVSRSLARSSRPRYRRMSADGSSASLPARRANLRKMIDTRNCKSSWGSVPEWVRAPSPN